MDDKPPFDLVRGVFWVVAMVVGTSMLASVAAGVACTVANFHTDMSACMKFNLRDFAGELLAVALLLLNTRPPAPPPPPPR